MTKQNEKVLREMLREAIALLVLNCEYSSTNSAYGALRQKAIKKVLNKVKKQ